MSEIINTENQGQQQGTGISSNEASEEVKREGEGGEEVHVAQDNELKVLPENEEEDKEEILIADSTKRPPSTTKTSSTNKKQQEGRRRQGRKKALPDEMTDILNRQTIQIDKMTSLLKSVLKQLRPLKTQPEAIKRFQSQLRVTQKQVSQIQKGLITKKRDNQNKKKRMTTR